MVEQGRPIRVGVAGLGRSGWNIHAAAIAALPGLFRVAAVADPEEARRHEAAARFSCRAYPVVDLLFADPSVDLVVIASPNHLHTAHTIAALQAGKHVICEKPMAAREEDAQAMIAAARRAGRLLTVFHNRRLEPHVAVLRNLLASGRLGRIVHVRAAVHRFTRRWDWQTLRQYGGGMLSNIGSHVLDLMLELFPLTDVEVFAHLDRVLTLGDAEDHCVLMLRGKEGPLLHLEITSAGAFPQDLWLVLGSRGSLTGGPQRLRWKIADFDHLPDRRLAAQPAAERLYPQDNVTWIEEQWTCPPQQDDSPYTHQRFYHNVYEALTQGAPLVVDPESVRRLVGVLEMSKAAVASRDAQVLAHA
jgi:predicted dehydrogenase